LRQFPRQHRRAVVKQSPLGIFASLGIHRLSSCCDGSPTSFECTGQWPFCHRHTNHVLFELTLAAQPLRCLANDGTFPYLSLWKGSEELVPLLRNMTERALTRPYVTMSYYQMNGVSTCERSALQIPAGTRRVIS
jgi:hypothetical protein